MNARITVAIVIFLIGIAGAAIDTCHGVVFGGLSYLSISFGLAWWVSGLCADSCLLKFAVSVACAIFPVYHVFFESNLMDKERQQQVSSIRDVLVPASTTEPRQDIKALIDKALLVCGEQSNSDAISAAHEGSEIAVAHDIGDGEGWAGQVDPAIEFVKRWFGHRAPPPMDCFYFYRKIRQEDPKIFANLEASASWHPPKPAD
jgi:hypothetical protein